MSLLRQENSLMPVYNYLPGVIVNTLDGGLVSPSTPQDDSILIIATAGQGPVNTPYQVTDRTKSFNLFGAKGTLSRSVEECATYSDNITVFRFGATPMTLSGVGLDTTEGSPSPGFGTPSTATFQRLGPSPPGHKIHFPRRRENCGRQQKASRDRTRFALHTPEPRLRPPEGGQK